MRKALFAAVTIASILSTPLSPAHASDVPAVFVHAAAGSPDGTGSWAWAKPGVPLVVHAEAPSAAATKLLRLERWDLVQLTGRDTRLYQVVNTGPKCSGLYDAVFRVATGTGTVCIDAVAH